MTCPDLDLLLEHPVDYAEHLAECPECSMLVSAVEEVRAAFAPPVVVPEAMVEATTARLRAVDERDRRRSVPEVLATLVLALLTVTPAALAGYSQADPSERTFLCVVAIIVAAAAFIALMEPKITAR